MSAGQVRRDQDAIEQFIHDPAPLVRSEAVAALARARVGATTIRRALRRERDELVLAGLCEAALLMEDRGSLPRLKKLCAHRSWLVRKRAAWAVSEIEEGRARPFLEKMLAREKSRRVRPILQAGLVKWGADNYMPDLLKNLKSRDYLVRCMTANALAENIRRRPRRSVVVTALQTAASREKTVAAGEAIKNAIVKWAHAPA